MKINYVLMILGGFAVAYLFFSFVAPLQSYLYNLGKETTQYDVQNYYFIKTFVILIGFVIGYFSFRKILTD